VRLFAAADLPAGTREHLADLLAELSREAPEIRWARPGSIHLTLKFLGEVAEEAVPSLAAALDRAAAEASGAIPIGVAGIGTFGERKRPRVVWVGITDPEGALARLAGSVERSFEREGFAPEDRPFSPHLTLARPKAPSPRLAAALASRSRIDLGASEIASVILFQSRLGPEGATYVRLHEAPLGGPAGPAP